VKLPAVGKMVTNTGGVFRAILIVSAVGMVVCLIFAVVGWTSDFFTYLTWIFGIGILIGSIGCYLETIGINPIKFVIWKSIFSFVLFILVYIWLIKEMPLSIWKFIWAFADSWVTGIIGTFLARAISRDWKVDVSIKNLMYNAFISLFYAAFIVLCVWALLADSLSIERFIVVFVILKISADAISYAIARKISAKWARGLEHFVAG